tara:strand:+ start:747 stop:1031 length:285 start_codon:yes stop_codon:yes gene_type:complete
MEISVKIQDATVIYIHSSSNYARKTETKIGILPDNFDKWEKLFDNDIDQKVYYWLTESEFKNAKTILKENELYALSEEYIFNISNNNKLIEVNL